MRSCLDSVKNSLPGSLMSEMIINFEQVVFLSSSRDEQSSINRNIGFRTVKLRQEQIECAPG